MSRARRHSIHFMCKGMSQAEVAHMFSHGFVCFRSFRADTGAPPMWATSHGRLQPALKVHVCCMRGSACCCNVA